MVITRYNHPSSLHVFFTTEMWERYGFYVVQSLLALYLAWHYHWHDDRIYALVGSFTAMTYLSPIVGGTIADKFLGQRWTILLGALWLTISYMVLAFFSSNLGLLIALSGIAVGTGLLKPNISSLLGNEYAIDSPLREQGFTIFYMGITAGIILGTTVPSKIYYYLGWQMAFASAALGMMISFSTFFWGMKHYNICDFHQTNVNTVHWIKAILLVLILWAVVFFVLLYPFFGNIVFTGVLVAALGYLAFTIKFEPKAQARQTMVIGILCFISVLFWAFYFQMFLSLTLFITRCVQLNIGTLSFPAPYYVGLQSVAMIIFGYIICQIKTHQQIKSIANKFLLAMLLMLVSYAIIVVICRINTNNTLLSPFALMPAYFIIALAELLLSPVGLSAITLLASRDNVSTMMGIFFVSLGLGAFLAGKLAQLTAINPTLLVLPNNHVSLLLRYYATAFNELLVILIIATLFCWLLNYSIKRLLSAT